MKKSAVETLTSVLLRPSAFIVPLTIDSVESFLQGFKLGIISQSDGVSYVDHANAWTASVKKRGWNVNALGLDDELTKKGLTTPEIVTEYLEIEIEAWKSLEVTHMV